MSPKKRKTPVSAPKPSAPDSPQLPEIPDYIVDKVFRRGSISLIGGPTYSGKTTLMFQIIRDWSAERPVFGQESYAAPCCYIAAVHSAGDAWDVMTRVGAEVKILSTAALSNSRSFEILCTEAISAVPGLEVIFLDGIHPMCNGNSNDPGMVTSTLQEISKLLTRFNLTLVATGCFSKPKDHYATGRDRFAGAYSWLQGSSSFTSIDFVNARNGADPRRTVMIHSKNGLATTLNYRFSGQGLLVPVLPGLSNAHYQIKYDDFDEVLFAHDPGTVLSRSEIVEIGDLFGLSESSIKRRLIELQDAGHLGYAKWGHYRIERKQ